MKKFMIYTRDEANMVKHRQFLRPAHLAYLTENADAKVVSAGPWLNDSGDAVGSFLVVEAQDEFAVGLFLDGDPYKTGGVTEKTTVKHLGGWRDF